MLFGLYSIYTADSPLLLVPISAEVAATVIAGLSTVFLVVPVIGVLAWGNLEPRAVALWAALSSAIAFVLSAYRQWVTGSVSVSVLPSNTFFTVEVGLALAHVFVIASAQEKKAIASYSTYFEVAWKLIVQTKLSILFVGFFWLVLWLGSTLFTALGLSFLDGLIESPWFAFTVTATAFSVALHVTDAKPEITSGVRDLLLSLMSWILPVFTLLITGFLLSLVVVGLQPLWNTRNATALLLSASAVLIILINTVYRDGRATETISLALKIALNAASFLLLPLLVIGTYALYLRVNDYGWTADRIIVAGLLSVGLVYGCGYTVAAALSRGKVLVGFGNTNVVAVVFVISLIAAMASPLLDPARVSVASQISRLRAHPELAERFDFYSLKESGQRYGVRALEHLSARDGLWPSQVAEEARLALEAVTRPVDVELKSPPPAAQSKINSRNLTVWPKGADLPPSFVNQEFGQFAVLLREKMGGEVPPCFLDGPNQCDIFLLDIDSDGTAEILVVSDLVRRIPSVIFKMGKDGTWTPDFTINNPSLACPDNLTRLKSGLFLFDRARGRSLQLGDEDYFLEKPSGGTSRPTCN